LVSSLPGSNLIVVILLRITYSCLLEILPAAMILIQEY
jgi:hypothetical protein